MNLIFLLKKTAEFQVKFESIKSLLKNNTDTDSKQKADKELREIQSELHNLSSSTKLSRLVETYELSLSQCRDAINDISKNEIKEQFQASINTLQAEGKDAINKSNEDALNRVIDILDELKMSALRESPQFWVGMLLYFDSNRHIFTNQTTANSLLSKAMKSLQNNDIDGLKESLFELSSLIRRDAKEKYSVKHCRCHKVKTNDKDIFDQKGFNKAWIRQKWI